MPSAAQQPDTTRPRADSARRIAPVVVREARRAPSVAGAASAVVTRVDSLRLPAAARLEEALREVPFVLVRRNSRGESELSVRASDSRQVAVLLDGIPLTLGWDHRTDPSLVPLQGARSITVVRGISTLLQGPNVLGGVVEVDVATGGADPPGEGRTLPLRAALSLDQVGARSATVAGGVLRHERSGGAADLRAGIGARSVPGIALGRGITDSLSADELRANSDADLRDAFAAARWRASGGAWAGATLAASSAERGVPPEMHVAEPRLWRYPRQTRAIGILSAGTAERPTRWGRGAAQASVALSDGRHELHDFDSPAFDRPVSTERGHERVISARARAGHTVARGARLDAAVTGGDVRFVERTDAERRYRQRLWSAGVEATSAPIGLTQLSGGVVADFADTPRSGDKPALGQLGAWGGRAGLTTVHLGSGTRLHLSASHRARFPSLRELYSGSLGRFVPNPGLRPERLLALETGATIRRGPVEAQASVFHHDLAHAIVREAAGDGRFRRANRDRVRSTGLEVLTAWTGERASVEADLMLQRARVAAPGVASRRPEHQPEIQADAELAARLAFGVRGSAAARYRGSQFCVHPDLGSDVRLAGRAKLDLGLERTWAGRGLARAVRAMFAVDNATDAAIYDQCGLPQPGRTIRLTIALN